MSAKAIFALAQALLIQSALSQCIGRTTITGTPSISCGTPALAYDGLTAWPGNGLACNGLWAGNNMGFDGLVPNWAGFSDGIYSPAMEITATSGGALPVTSASVVAPNSILVESENVYEGLLAVAGEMPFVGTVGLEGVLPTAGTGAVNHACGSGVRIISLEGPAASAGLVQPIATGFATDIITPVAARGFAADILSTGRLSAPVFGSGFATANVLTGIGGYSPAAGITPAAAISPAASFGFNTGLANSAYPAANWASTFPGLAAPYGLAAPALAYDGFAYPGAAPYGGAGEGNVAVVGELPVAGSTAVAGQVPIMGSVRFGGDVLAAGAVSITAQCACGCGNFY